MGSQASRCTLTAAVCRSSTALDNKVCLEPASTKTLQPSSLCLERFTQIASHSSYYNLVWKQHYFLMFIFLNCSMPVLHLWTVAFQVWIPCLKHYRSWRSTCVLPSCQIISLHVHTACSTYWFRGTWFVRLDTHSRVATWPSLWPEFLTDPLEVQTVLRGHLLLAASTYSLQPLLGQPYMPADQSSLLPNCSQ